MRQAMNYGTLYVVATPIGNMDDMTFRAVATLKQVDMVFAEDTRRAKKLFSKFDIKNKLFSFYEHNEDIIQEKVVNFLKDGLSLALISDAGTPCISDPGFKLVQKARNEKIAVVPIPGVSAITSAFSVSGLPNDSFIFLGFSNRNKTKRKKEIEALKDEQRTLIFYESPQRILSFIEDFVSIAGDRDAFVAREMTKKFEEFVFGKLTEVADILGKKASIKGEITIVIAGNQKSKEQDFSFLEQLLKEELKKKRPILEAAKEIAKKTGVSKNAVYKKLLG